MQISLNLCTIVFSHHSKDLSFRGEDSTVDKVDWCKLLVLLQPFVGHQTCCKMLRKNFFEAFCTIMLLLLN
jgi:hypothetical protein